MVIRNSSSLFGGPAGKSKKRKTSRVERRMNECDDARRLEHVRDVCTKPYLYTGRLTEQVGSLVGSDWYTSPTVRSAEECYRLVRRTMEKPLSLLGVRPDALQMIA